jgi:hypothetical protein
VDSCVFQIYYHCQISIRFPISDTDVMILPDAREINVINIGIIYWDIRQFPYWYSII